MAEGNADPNAAAIAAAAQATAAAGAAAADANGAAELARLQAQVEAATGSVAKAFATTQAALRAANPTLPETVFEAPDLDTLIANVQAHQATAQHVTDQINAQADGAAPPAPALPAAPITAGIVRELSAAPAGTKGLDRIKFGLNQRS